MCLQMQRTAAMGLALVAALFAAGCEAGQVSYSAKPVTAKVVDAETGQLVEGVNVVASWALEDLAWKEHGDLEKMEAVTDRNGEFHFPAWGPKIVPPGEHPGMGLRLGIQDPTIVFFKKGYQLRGVSNDSHSRPREPYDPGPSVRDSQWDGKTITLEKFKGNQRQYAMMISGVLSIAGVGNCGWKKMPRMVVAVNRESERLVREKVVKVTPASPTIDDLVEYEDKEKCGSVRKFFEEYLK